MDIDEMLRKTTEYLVVQARRPLKEFLPIAYKVQLRESDWAKFWKAIRSEI